MGEINTKNTDTHGTPSAGYTKMYPKTDKKWYSKDDTGTENEIGSGATPGAHASTHVDGTDDIQDASASQKGLATVAQITKLDGIESGAEVNDVASVFGRTGTVSAADSDYDASQVDNDSAVAGDFVDDALNTLNAAIAALTSGMTRQSAVIDYVDSTATPPTEISGDRYILDFSGTPHADWDGAAQGDLVEFNGSTWGALSPEEGWVAYVDAENQDRLYVDDGTPDWEARPANTRLHSDLTDVTENQHHNRQHALDSTTDHSALSDTTNFNASSLAHGFLPKLSSDSGQYLDGSGAWSSPPVAGWLDGLEVSWYSNTQVQIAAGGCRNSVDDNNIAVSSALTVAVTSSGANGLDTGSEASSTWYYVFVIQGTSGVAGLLSTSATSPTLPSGYTKFRRVGAVYNNSSGNFNHCYYYGRGKDKKVYYNETQSSRQTLNGGTASSFTNVDCSVWIPPVAATYTLAVTVDSPGPPGADSARFRPDGFSVASDGVLGIIGDNSASFELPNYESDGVVEYYVTGGGLTVDIVVVGYTESL